jgi:F0F1-type ATP synthase epsilon subunit
MRSSLAQLQWLRDRRAVARTLRLSVLAPAGPLVSAEEVAWIQARLADGGSIGIWPGHAPLLAETIDGPLRYSDGASEYALELRAGVLHIDSVGATVLIPGTVETAPEAGSSQDAVNLATSRSGGAGQ